jgi:hypothetical protein
MRHDAHSLGITLRRFALLPALALAVVALAPASALADAPSPGDIPDNQAFVAYKGQGFSVKVPEGWSRATQGGGTRFVDKYNAITVTTTRQSAKPTIAGVRRRRRDSPVRRSRRSRAPADRACSSCTARRAPGTR